MIQFNVEFTPDLSKIKSNPQMYRLADKSLKTPEFKQEHCCALFKYITREWANDDLYMPDVCKELGVKYLMKHDDFANWFLDNYEKTEEFCCLGVRECFRHYKESDFYRALPKVEQRRLTESAFKDGIRTNIVLKKYKPRVVMLMVND